MASGALLSSKIVIVEEEPRLRSIPSVPTAVVGAIGVAERGPIAEAVFITSFEDYVNQFGGFTADADLALAVSGFFLNGGSQMWVVRTVHFTDVDDATTSTAAIARTDLVDRAGSPLDTLRIEGKSAGAYGNNLTVKIAAATSGDADEFNLTVLEDSVVLEVFPNLSMTDTDPNYVETVVNNENTGSSLIQAIDLDSATATPDDLPALGDFALGSTVVGSDGLTNLGDNDFIGSDAGETGIHSLDPVQTLNLLIVPGQATSAIHNAMLSYCEVDRLFSCFAVLDCPAGLDGPGIVSYVNTTAAIGGLSEMGAIYWPRVKVLNPSKAVFGAADQLTVPPSGHITGMYSRTDGSKPGGVYDPPAGIEKGKLFGVLGFENDDVKKEAVRDLIFPARINPITVYPGSPRHVDGARTLKGDGNFPSVSERRGATFIEQSIKLGLLYVKNQNNSEALRASAQRTVDAFLLTQLNNDAFASHDPSKAFFSDFSEKVNPPSVQFANTMVGRIGLAFNKPTEFVVLKFSADTRAIEEELANAGLS